MRKYLIILTSELSKVDFNQILERSISELGFSIDGTKTFIRWQSDTDPTFLIDLSYMEGPYNNSEMITILSGPEWFTESV